ncbi:MAG: type II toxin-antitoxin system HicA family toxin [Chitinophagia bacterium]|jgi:predicted RNA binding protein YcfA (HicA-like mRNA interferase family)
MSKKKKLLNRLLEIPSDFTWGELIAVLKLLGYQQVASGITGGSRRRFVNLEGKVILIHEPHPRRIVKKYVLRLVIEKCKEEIKNHE